MRYIKNSIYFNRIYIYNVSVKEGLTLIPLKFVNIRIESKLKRGRKRKIKGGEALLNSTKEPQPKKQKKK
jgi:hypothetical protein